MKPDQIKLMQADIQAVADKHGVSRWAFGGETEQIFVGFMEGTKMTEGDAMKTIINVGRLWQYARQTCRNLLDTFERSV